jgi:hypothetical protein
MGQRTALRRGLAAALAPALAALLVAACDDATDPAGSPLAGQVFALTSVGGAGLPTVMNAYQGDTTFLVADTLRFRADGSVARGLWMRTRGVHGTTADSSRWTSQYRVAGTRIEIGFFAPCPPTALCIANEVGTVLGDEMLLTVGTSPPPPDRRYRRVGRE